MAEMMSFGCELKGSRIEPELSADQIRRHLFETHGALVLKNVFPGQELLRLRDQVWSWGKRVPLSPPQTFPDSNYHGVEIGVSRLQKTSHVYHAYNFNRIMELPAELKSALLHIWEPMREFQNRIAGAHGGWEKDEAGRKLHPQIIQYPCGGGMFSSHVHAFEPQKLGLILAISKRGVDFKTGGTGFELLDQQGVDTSNLHDLGDMILFKYNIKHWISFVDLEEQLQLDSSRGRWTMVLPYY